MCTLNWKGHCTPLARFVCVLSRLPGLQQYFVTVVVQVLISEKSLRIFLYYIN